MDTSLVRMVCAGLAVLFLGVIVLRRKREHGISCFHGEARLVRPRLWRECPFGDAARPHRLAESRGSDVVGSRLHEPRMKS